MPGGWGERNPLKNENWDFSLGPTKEGFFFFLSSFLLNLVGFDTKGIRLGAYARQTANNLY